MENRDSSLALAEKEIEVLQLVENGPGLIGSACISDPPQSGAGQVLTWRSRETQSGKRTRLANTAVMHRNTVPQLNPDWPSVLKIVKVKSQQAGCLSKIKQCHKRGFFMLGI